MAAQCLACFENNYVSAAGPRVFGDSCSVADVKGRPTLLPCFRMSTLRDGNKSILCTSRQFCMRETVLYACFVIHGAMLACMHMFLCERRFHPRHPECHMVLQQADTHQVNQSKPDYIVRTTPYRLEQQRRQLLIRNTVRMEYKIYAWYKNVFCILQGFGALSGDPYLPFTWFGSKTLCLSKTSNVFRCPFVTAQWSRFRP